MVRGRAILVAWAAVAMPTIAAALASCVQDLPAGSPPEVPDGTSQDAPTPPEDHTTTEGSPDAPPEDAAPDVSEDVSDAESADADAETTNADAGADVLEGGIAPDSGDAGDASNTADASDASSASDASDAAGGNDAASDASTPPCTYITSGAECQGSDSCTMQLPASSVAGDLLVLVFAAGVSITPTVPSGWMLANFENDSTNALNVGIWYYPNNPGGISSVTATIGAAGSVRGILSEWRNATQADQTAILWTPSSKSLTVSTPGITANGECAIAAFGQKVSIARSVTFTAGSGWTNLDNNDGAATDYHVTADYLLAPPVGAVSENETSDTLGNWVGVLATFR